MPETMTIAVYRAVGRSETKEYEPEPGQVTAKREEPPPPHPTLETVVSALNQNSITLASEIEAEIRKIMPLYPLIMVQAEVRFRKGSLLMAATVTLLSWTGSIILDAVREELSQVIRVAIQRVMANALNIHGKGLAGAMEIEVAPVRDVGRPRRPARTILAQDLSRSPVLSVTVFILTMLVLLLLADRFFVISKRDSISAPIAPVTSQSSSPQPK